MFRKLLVSAIPFMPKSLVWSVGKRYIAGLTLEDAVLCTRKLSEHKGCGSTIDVLGEFVTEKERALMEVEASLVVLNTIVRENIPSYLSIKPTSQGLGIDFDFGYTNIRKLVSFAAELGVRCRVDMENSPYTDETIEVFRRLKNEGFDNVGIVLQTYLKRTYDDIVSLLPLKPNIRICKGIYIESAGIAYKDKEEIRDNYKKCLDLIIDNIPNGAFPAIATHDEPLIRYAEDIIKNKKLDREQYSFEMLLGVREERRLKLLKEGHNVTIYVPFGEDWYGYSTRRMKANPEVAVHILKATFGIGK